MGAADVPVIRAIVGPTAAGKSAIALWLALRHPLVVVSADSRQIYRRFDVGTAKPSVAERAIAPHAGIDVVDPTDRYSAFAWAAAASRWIDDARAAGRTPVVVGGTGLYVRALVGASFDEPPLDPARRAALGRVLGEMSSPELARWCEALDPERAVLGRTQLLRAIEVALLTGHRLSVLHVTRRRTPPYRARYLVVDPGRPLAERIVTRARTMLNGGWIEEVRELDAIVPAAAPAWNSSGYRAVRALVRGETTPEQALERIVVDTRQYAKRQRTWFRHQLPERDVTRVDPTSDGWEEIVERWWNKEPNE